MVLRNLTRSLKRAGRRRFRSWSPPRSSVYVALARFGPTSREKFWLKPGKVSEGLTVILSGKVDVARHALSGNGALIVTHVAGAFLGELAQLAGRPALVDAKAQDPVDALVIPPERLRALLIAEAELGERIMRALILRRVGLLEDGSAVL